MSDMMGNAKELMKFPLDVKFENLGPNVNSPYADYYPFVPSDESFIIFKTRFIIIFLSLVLF